MARDKETEEIQREKKKENQEGEGRGRGGGGGSGMDGEKLPAVSWKTPLVFQSKLLCLSLLYLLTSLFLSIHVSISQTGCVFRFSPLTLSDHERHLGHPLFSYPTVYGEHKHALPSSSPFPTCDSPVLFPDVPDTAIILRRHGLRSNLFSCLLFNELEAFNPRDQVPFAYVRDLMRPKIKINMFPAEVLEQIAVEYRHNLKRPQEEPPSEGPAREKRRRASSRGIAGSSCEGYLQKMWGEEANESE